MINENSGSEIGLQLEDQKSKTLASSLWLSQFCVSKFS